MRTLPTTILLLLLAAPALRAQAIPADSLARGTRVRVTAPSMYDHRLSGQVWHLSPDSLVIGDSEGWSQTTIPVAAVERIDVSYGRSGGAVLGGIAGGAVFGAAAYMYAVLSEQQIADAQRNTLAIGSVGALFGALLGHAWGESWHRVFPPR